MKDPQLFRELTANQAAATAICRDPLGQYLGKTFGLGKARRTEVLEEYCRFRYLTLIADAPLAPPPILSELWQHNRSDFDSTDNCVRLFSGIFCPRELSKSPDYHRALSLYQDEFGQPPPPAVWPSPNDLIITSHMTVALIGGFLVVILGAVSDLDWLGFAGIAIFGVGFFWLGFWAPLGVTRPGD